MIREYSSKQCGMYHTAKESACAVNCGTLPPACVALGWILSEDSCGEIASGTGVVVALVLVSQFRHWAIQIMVSLTLDSAYLLLCAMFCSTPVSVVERDYYSIIPALVKQVV